MRPDIGEKYRSLYKDRECLHSCRWIWLRCGSRCIWEQGSIQMLYRRDLNSMCFTLKSGLNEIEWVHDTWKICGKKWCSNIFKWEKIILLIFCHSSNLFIDNNIIPELKKRLINIASPPQQRNLSERYFWTDFDIFFSSSICFWKSSCFLSIFASYNLSFTFKWRELIN